MGTNVGMLWLRSWTFGFYKTQESPDLPTAWWFVTTDFHGRSHSDTPHSVGLLWTRDQPDVETSTWQHTTLARDKHSWTPGGIRTRNPACERPQTDALDRAATGTGLSTYVICHFPQIYDTSYLNVSACARACIHTHTHTHTYIYIWYIQVSREECVRLRENVPYVKVHRYNPKHLHISEVERLRR